MASDKPGLLIYTHGDRLGDALIKLPALSVLREAYPNHRITWLAGSKSSAYRSSLQFLVKDYLDEVIDSAEIGRSILDYLRPVSFPEQDIIIDTQKVLRSTLSIKRIPHRIFISSTANFFFSDIRPNNINLYNKSSIQDRLLFLFGLCAGKVLQHNYKLDLPQEFLELAITLLPEGPIYIGMAPGAGGRKKCWPLENYINIAKTQVKNGRVPVFFLGPDEKDWVEKIKKKVPAALFPDMINAPLLALALGQRLAVALANDSGTGHILATAGVPLVSLFGPSNSMKFVASEKNRIIIEAKDFGGTDMNYIPIQTVITAIEEQISCPT
jgi:ADP-heptose:LPS heptosyltransferase